MAAARSGSIGRGIDITLVSYIYGGRVAIVTGGASGIGRATVERLAGEGATVAIFDVNQEAGDKYLADLGPQNTAISFHNVDVTDKNQCLDAVKAVADANSGKIHYLSNNAVYFGSKGMTAEKDDWEKSFSVNVIGYANMVQACQPYMTQVEGEKSIVHMASTAGHVAQVNRWTYSSMKGAVLTMTKCMALDLAKYKIRVNSVSPAWVWSPEVSKAAGGDCEKWEPAWGLSHMRGRLPETSEIASVTCFLLSNDASFITGTDIKVDGGNCSMGPGKDSNFCWFKISRPRKKKKSCARIYHMRIVIQPLLLFLSANMARSDSKLHSSTSARNRFTGRVAIVTGGASGIGRATVERLAGEGVTVAIFDVNQEAGDKYLADLGPQNTAISFHNVDVSDKNQCLDAVKAVADANSGKIHYLSNNAVYFGSKGMTAEKADWEKSFSVNVIGYANMVQACQPYMTQVEGEKSIVNMASISGHIAQANRWTYSSTKGAILTMTKCMALDLAKDKIRVNSVSPAWVWSPEVSKAAGGDREKWEPAWGLSHMLGRLPETSEIASVTCFLLSDDASFITGTDIKVDGGYCSMGPEGHGKDSNFAGSEY